jgi:hypothetical protein
MATFTPVPDSPPAHLVAPVSLGRFPVTVIDPLHGLMAWHCRWAGTATFPDGSKVTWEKTGLTRIGYTDICVVRFTAPTQIKPVVIVPEIPAWIRNQFGVLRRVLQPKNYNNMFTTWSRTAGLIDKDSGSPLLANLGLNNYVGFVSFATGYTSGPRLWHYRKAIEEAKQ